MTVQWCDPPAPGVWSHILLPIMEQPGRWAKVRVYDRPRSAAQAAKDLRRGARGLPGSLTVPPGRWEFRSGQVEPDAPGWAVWARYLGADQIGDL